MKNILILFGSILLLAAASVYYPIQVDATLTGEGTVESPLKVDTTIVSTRLYVATQRDDNRALAVIQPNESKSNSTVADQDYTSLYTIPANYLITNKALRVSILFEVVSGSSTVTCINYLKLGSTKVAISGAAQDFTNSTTKSIMAIYTIMGTAAAGGSVSVICGSTAPFTGNSGTGTNSTDQPVAAIATNGTLNIVPGITFSGTGSTETVTILFATIEEVN
jgi:hypothetical protein